MSKANKVTGAGWTIHTRDTLIGLTSNSTLSDLVGLMPAMCMLYVNASGGNYLGLQPPGTPATCQIVFEKAGGTIITARWTSSAGNISVNTYSGSAWSGWKIVSIT